MGFKPRVAVFDACILYPFHTRNILVQAAVDRLVEAHWTEAIHDEWIRNLAANSPSVSAARLHITHRLMNDALPSATVTRYESFIEAVTLPDPGDRHVVAAGIAAGASLILTWNLRDFPTTELRKHHLKRQTPDAFLAGIYDQVPELLVGSLANARRNLSKTRVSASQFIDILHGQRLVEVASHMRNHLTSL